MILHTGIALGVILVVLACVLAIFQYRDKVCLLLCCGKLSNVCFFQFQIEDDRERKMQSQRFHYDAL